MSDTLYMIICVVLMALVTYVLRAIPMLFFRKKIKSVFISSVLYYMPYAVLSAMTFPAIFYVTESIFPALIGCFIALFSAVLKRSLLTVAVLSCLAVLVCLLIF
jgi:branched-subunit amino acid transport protein